MTMKKHRVGLRFAGMMGISLLIGLGDRDPCRGRRRMDRSRTGLAGLGAGAGGPGADGGGRGDRPRGRGLGAAVGQPLGRGGAARRDRAGRRGAGRAGGGDLPCRSPVRDRDDGGLSRAGADPDPLRALGAGGGRRPRNTGGGGDSACGQLCRLAMQGALVRATKRLYPEKQGNVLDLKFQKEWFGSCDEAERQLIWQCGYQSMRVTSRAMLAFFVLLVIFGNAAPIGRCRC